MFRWLSTFQKKMLVSFLTLTHFQLKLTLKHTNRNMKVSVSIALMWQAFLLRFFFFSARCSGRRKRQTFKNPSIRMHTRRRRRFLSVVTVNRMYVNAICVEICATFKSKKMNMKCANKIQHFDEDVNSTEGKLQVTAATAITTAN